ncbi:MAG: TIGR03905 family TSCPD domain-containing protein [Clostridia bacterium]|nr:TIGR03905 family TSCPD domain-containing protein [Clostridia bacterium]
MRQFNYRPKGVCSMEIQFELDDLDMVHNVQFIGGCPGNTVGVATLAEGKNAHELVAKLKGIDCRGRGTSCPDQLAKALAQALASK